MKALDTIADAVGNTPLLRIHGISENAYAKCEFLNPISVKDRPILNILEQAERAGLLKKGDTLIESTSGNTGMAIAFLAAIRGYRAILVMSEIQSVERRQVMAAFGAQLILTPAAEGTAGARKRMRAILEEHPEYFYVGQHVRPGNPDAHYATTGPEIWRDSAGEVDILVAGIGTGGTLCGAGRYLREQKPGVRLVGVEPESAPFISQGVFKPHRLMGLAPGFLPETMDKSLVDEYALVSEAEAFEMCRRLAAGEGILVGISSGAVAVAMERLAARPENAGKVIVGIFADSGQRYLSVEDLFRT